MKCITLKVLNCFRFSHIYVHVIKNADVNIQIWWLHLKVFCFLLYTLQEIYRAWACSLLAPLAKEIPKLDALIWIKGASDSLKSNLTLAENFLFSSNGLTSILAAVMLKYTPWHHSSGWLQVQQSKLLATPNYCQRWNILETFNRRVQWHNAFQPGKTSIGMASVWKQPKTDQWGHPHLTQKPSLHKFNSLILR